MAGFRRADKVVVGDVQLCRHRLKLGGNAVTEGHGINPLGLGRFFHLLTMLVGAGQEHHVIAIQPLEPGDHITGNRLIGMTQMGRSIHIGNRSRDIESLLRVGRHIDPVRAHQSVSAAEPPPSGLPGTRIRSTDVYPDWPDCPIGQAGR